MSCETQNEIIKDLSQKITNLSEALEKEERRSTEYLNQLVSYERDNKQQRAIVNSLMSKIAALREENKKLRGINTTPRGIKM